MKQTKIARLYGLGGLPASPDFWDEIGEALCLFIGFALKKAPKGLLVNARRAMVDYIDECRMEEDIMLGNYASIGDWLMSFPYELATYADIFVYNTRMLSNIRNRYDTDGYMLGKENSLQKVEEALGANSFVCYQFCGGMFILPPAVDTGRWKYQRPTFGEFVESQPEWR